MILVVLIVLFFCPPDPGKPPSPSDPDPLKQIFASFYTFRFLLMILFTVASAGFGIKILRRFKVNYLFIFELDPNYKVTYMQLIRITLMLFTIWGFCFAGQILIIKLGYIFEPKAWFTLAALIIFFGFCFAPLHCFYMRARKELLIVLWNIFISPFGLVRFKHFFLADILTSFVIPLKDIGSIVFFFVDGLWETSDTPSTSKSDVLKYYTIVVAFLPYWFRFAQCFVRYKETNLTAHLINAGKYFSSICIQAASAAKILSSNQPTYPASVAVLAVVSFLSTVYCLYWDYKMDWGLLRSSRVGKKYLRDKLLFPVWFYYYAMISNFFLRFLWVLGLLPETVASGLNKDQLIPFIQCLFEGFRRAQWALIRIENENVNNFERYRTILQIPAFKEDYEEEGAEE